MTNEATIRRIDLLEPIPGADKIEVATVGGWKVVVQKNIHKVGDLVVYIAIDTWLPVNEAWAFLDKAAREYVGYGLGYKVRSIKLRGQISQGTILPLAEFHQDLCRVIGLGYEIYEGLDLSDFLGAKHWEKPILGNMKGRVKGNFPSFLRKTDQERAQNLTSELFGREPVAEPDWSKVPADKVEMVKANWEAKAKSGQYKQAAWELSTKLDGSSITVYYKDGQVGVCSRNLELDMADTGNVFVKTAIESGIIGILQMLKKNWAIQGELMGPGIQDNHENLGRPEIFVFDIYDIDQSTYLTPDTRQRAVLALGLRHVPAIRVMQYEFNNMDELLKMATGPSMINEMREGLVFKHEIGEFSFKVINNDFLLAKGE